jgi:hypothetical protein
MMSALFALSGLTAGAAQAGLLARSNQAGPHPVSLILRLVLVGAVLLFAAQNGHLAIAFAAWSAGFVVAAGAVYRRMQ